MQAINIECACWQDLDLEAALDDAWEEILQGKMLVFSANIDEMFAFRHVARQKCPISSIGVKHDDGTMAIYFFALFSKTRKLQGVRGIDGLSSCFLGHVNGPRLTGFHADLPLENLDSTLLSGFFRRLSKSCHHQTKIEGD